MIEFLLPALCAGLLLTLVTGPLGCLIVWRRMAYFGDTLAHSALLGLTLGLLLDIDIELGITAGCVGIALLLTFLQHQTEIATDTLLGILAHSCLAFGMIALSFYQDRQIDLMAFLFGDLLAIRWQGVGWLAAGVAVTAIALRLLWPALLRVTLHADLAAAEGLSIPWLRLAFMLMLSLVIALAMKLVGVLLITALLIIPAAAARSLARSPGGMALLASLAGTLAVVGGLALSWYVDSPSGPSIVASATLLFLISLCMRRPA